MAINKGRAPTRKAWAVGVSLIVHALVGLGLWRWPASPPRDSVPLPDLIQIGVEVYEPAASPTGLTPGLAPHRVRRRAPPVRPAATLPGDPEANIMMRLRGGASRLALDARTLERFERDRVIAPTPAPDVPSLARGPSYSERLAAQARDTNARMNVAAGHVQPFLYDYVRAARRDFKPAEGRLYADPRSPNTVRRAVRAWAREAFIADPRYLAWQGLVAAKRAAARGGALEQADVLRRYGQMIDDNDAGHAPIASMICVVLQPDAPPRIEVNTSSGNRELDRAAIESLARAASSRPPDPDIKPQRACYHFTAAVERAAPIPISGCAFDEVKMTLGCYHPAMKILRTNVTLASVDERDGR